MKGVFLILVCSIISIIIDAQDHYELIIQLEPKESILQIERVLDESVVSKRLLSSRMNIWKLEVAKKKSKPQAAIQKLKDISSVKFIQNNKKVSLRDIEFNDPHYSDQWSLNNTGQTGGKIDADIDLPETINFIDSLQISQRNVVVAVIDNGFDLSHADINYWINESEIPDNLIDDDDNGYVDDYLGWNAYSDTSSIPVGSHGTHVAGIISAVSNNGFGISGISEKVSVLPIAGSSTDEATVIAAYSYALEMKLQYLESGGEKGANIVVTNSSFGVDKGNPDDYPIWSALYDTLGNYGILSCAATANSTWDVDEVGDMPTACPSDFLISVTNTTHLDRKNSSAAYGRESIDLGAPGTSIISTIPTNDFGYKSGTSMATPITSACTALLYTFNKNQNLSLSQKSLLIKEAILSGTEKVSDLENKTVSEGRLNLLNSLKYYLDDDRIYVAYEKGWNIVSIPNIESKTHENNFISRASNIFEYDDGYNIVDSLDYGKGYWIKYDNISQESFSKGTSEYSTSLKSGWNLIGAKDSTISTNSLTTSPNNIIASSFFSFENGYNKVDSLSPGRGYWVKADADGILSETTQLPKQFSNTQVDPALKINFTALTDQGDTQVVSIGIDSTATDGIDTHLGEQELPPPPPSEIFFIRFTLPNSFISSYSDIRFGELDENYTYEHELQFQLGESANELILEWEQPQGVEINIQDMFGGVIIDEDFNPGSNEFTLTNTNITSLKLTAKYSGVTSVQDENKPLEYALFQNYPNPFNPSTIIKYGIPKDAKVKIDIYNALGQRVRTLIDKQMEAGYHEIQLNANDLASGIYFYRISVGSFIDTKKMTIIK